MAVAAAMAIIGDQVGYLIGKKLGPAVFARPKSRLFDPAHVVRANEFFAAAHDLSQGGLSATLTEMVLRHNVGAEVEINDAGTVLISESPGRVVVAVESAKSQSLIALATKHQISVTKIGVTGGSNLVINGAVISLTELRKANTETFAKLFG